jgi:hypothetical protein
MGRPRSVAPVEATSGLGLLFFFSELGLLQSPVMEPMAGIELPGWLLLLTRLWHFSGEFQLTSVYPGLLRNSGCCQFAVSAMFLR